MSTKPSHLKTESTSSSMKVSVRTNSILSGSLSPKDCVEVELRSKSSSSSCSKRQMSKCTREESFADDATNCTDPSGSEIARLVREFPLLTREEVQRFWEDHQQNNAEDESEETALEAVREHLSQFVEWRNIYGLGRKSQHDAAIESFEQDQRDWKAAWKKVWDREESGLDLFPPSKDPKQQNKKSSKSYPRKEIPQFFFCYASQEDPNQIMLQLLPARIEAYSATPEQHSAACQLYFDRRFDHSNPHQKATLCLDCRGNPQWTNANVFQLQPIISACTHHLVQYHPGRTDRLIIFPVPRLAVSLFEMIKKALPPVIQHQTQLVAGSERNCNLPKMAEKGNVPLALLERMEKTRERIIAEKC